MRESLHLAPPEAPSLLYVLRAGKAAAEVSRAAAFWLERCGVPMGATTAPGVIAWHRILISGTTVVFDGHVDLKVSKKACNLLRAAMPARP